MIKLTFVKDIDKKGNFIWITDNADNIPTEILNKKESEYLKKMYGLNNQTSFVFNRLSQITIVKIFTGYNSDFNGNEMARKAGNDLLPVLQNLNVDSVTLSSSSKIKESLLYVAEGLILGAYSFNKYKSKNVSFSKDVNNTTKKFKDNANKNIKTELKQVIFLKNEVAENDVEFLKIQCEAVFRCRDMVNEPALSLTAQDFSSIMAKWGKEAGAVVEILDKKRIKALKMGGLLAVNKGSVLPPTFSVIEWKPLKCVNKQTVVIVGKGVTFDTGGISLKSAANMIDMKSDMSGAAVTAALVCAVAKAKLPINVIGLIPATDNRPGPEAIVPGDIITMMDGTTVEVMNTDAEGRLILADALCFAKKYKPSVVIDIATLTGSAQAAIGNLGIVAMHHDASPEMEELKNAGRLSYERLAELPNWPEYKDMIKSEIADLKNVGGKYAGAITAFKFLEHFVEYPYIHLDIAGPAFLETRDSYRGQGGTGVGVRLLLTYLRNKILK